MNGWIEMEWRKKGEDREGGRKREKERKQGEKETRERKKSKPR